MNAVCLKNVSKEFKGDFWKKKVRVLKDVSFQVNQGDIYGLVGPNGAGKTTSMKILLGLIRATEGEVTVFGKPVTSTAFKRDLGYLPEHAYYYDYLKADEVLDFYGRLFGLNRSERHRRTDELLSLVGLADKRHIRLRNFSKGMLQRVGIAQALINNPKLVIFDEPMSGLDPIGRKEVRDIILNVADQGKTVMFTSHILSDVEAICERVAIIIKGQIQAEGKLSDLVRTRIRSTEVMFEGESSFEIPMQLREQIQVRISGHQSIVSTSDEKLLIDVIEEGRNQKLKLVSVVPHRETLEDLFLEQVKARQ